MIYNKDTITAIITPSFVSPISIIRLSGNKSISIVDKFFYQSSKKIKEKLNKKKSHSITFGNIIDNGNIIDHVLIFLFKSPHSYTGEDIVEISCHGSLFIQNKILDMCVINGARIAKAGEFTLRAFLNKKIDLSQAEAIADLISSESDVEHKIAINQLSGIFSKKIKSIKNNIIEIASLIEFNLDFSEENFNYYSNKDFNNNLLKKIKNVKESIKILINYNSMKNIAKNGVKIAIVGPTNSGKSTLINSLINDDASIVSDIPGTTRDSIEYNIIISGIKFIIIDTAGIRNTDDNIEKIGIKKSYDKINISDIILYVFDSTIFNENIKDFFILKNKYKDKKFILIANKSDLCSVLYDKIYDNKILKISAKNNLGIDNIKDYLIYIINNKKISFIEKKININNRHYQSLKKTLKSIINIDNNLKKNITLDLISFDIKNAINSLEELTGNISTEQILKNIFSNFCIGK